MSRPRSEQLRARIVGFVREKGTASRGDIGREFSLDKKAVSLIVEALLSGGILAISGLRESRAGRPSELLSVNAGQGSVIGIDLGATHVLGVLTDLGGRVLDRAWFEIRPGLPVDIILDQMRSIGGKLLASANAGAGVKRVGMCVPGFVQPATGTSLVAENIPGWRDVRIRETFESAFQRPVTVDDASRALAVAERWLGHGRGVPDFLVLDLGYGIGMGIVAGGALHRGSGWKSGEIGHCVVASDGEPCACGNRGCLETVASGRAIARRASAGILEGRSPLLKDLTHGNAGEVTAQDVAVAASMGDGFAADLLRAAGGAIGTALAQAVNILNPALVILGGGLVSAGRPFTDSISASFERNAMPGIREDTRLAVSELGVDGSARGSAQMAADLVVAGA